ncbi:hypothetical protein INR49_000581 [Caranx melampygus]|nr:hypothetical protein INR49_000581 [Caranx melampygus]
MLLRGLVSVALLFHTLTGVSGFEVTTNTPVVKVKENEGTDLKCSYSADFGKDARVEWKFKNLREPYSNRVTLYGSNIRINKVTASDNGVYNCEVSGNGQFGEAVMTLIVLVPPGKPTCRIPTSVTTNNAVTLTCHDGTGSPPPIYKWYKNGTPLPVDPKKIAAFQNSTYTLNATSGELKFAKTAKFEAGDYYCEAFNEAGPPQRCGTVRMEVQKNESRKPNMVYQPTSEYGGEDDDGDFKQKSSFVV